MRLAYGFAQERRLYGGPITELPLVRARLAGAYRRLRLADALALYGTRALSLLPEQMSLLSAALKIAIPRLAMDVVRECATVLGARHYLRTGPFAPFQKILRDAPLIALFDGSAEVNASIIAGQLERVARARGDERTKRGDEAFDLVSRAARLADAIPPMPWGALKTSNRGRDDLLLSASDPRRGGSAAIRDAVHALDAEARKDAGELARFSSVERYVWLNAAASAHFVCGPGGLGAALEEEALHYAAGRVPPLSERGYDALADQCTRGELLSAAPFTLAGAMAG